jgi:ribosomal-protein-alanine N-acetyltransferase
MGTFTVAKETEIIELQRFLDKESLNHRHLDWSGIAERIAEGSVAFLREKGKLMGAICIPHDPAGNTWVRLCAVHKGGDPLSIGAQLLDFSLGQVHRRRTRQSVYTVCFWDWYEQLLKHCHFTPAQSIVTLEKRLQTQSGPTIPPIIGDLKLSDITSVDASSVAKLDQICFSPPWQLCGNEIRYAIDQTDYRTGIFDGKNLIAYQLSSQNQYTAHISRLAVHPQYRRTGLGSLLLLHIEHHYIGKKAWGLSVNTQADNLASISLYHHNGFSLTGETFPVLSHSDENTLTPCPSTTTEASTN